ncbi:hypothetical protein [Gaoshiqia sp. Z1-71]|uniref:hypothetical protein n=1 Tax=Gaoshiqia hydrogeniformans TaxID=3290090 RepID=UPI003BF8E7EC
MKQAILVLIACVSFGTAFAQNTPLRISLYGESGYYFPSANNSPFKIIRDGYSAGFGISGLAPVYKKWGLAAGLGYRYLHNGTTTPVYDSENQGGYGYGYGYDTPVYTLFEDYPKHYLLVPLKLRYTTNRKLFFESGIETAWLLNYKYTTKNTEFNWVLGTGISVGRMEWSVQYSQALGEQSIGGAASGGPWEQEEFKNRNLSVQVSCPVWSIGKKAKGN